MRNILKILLFYLFSIGFFLLKFDWVTCVIECACKNDVFPKYYAFPFIYKSNGIGNSMSETFYGSGILLNGLIIMVLLLIFDFYLNRLLTNQKFILKVYSFLQIVLLLLSIYSYYISYTFVSDDRFEWKSDFKEQKKNYNAECEKYFKGIVLQ